MPDKMTAAERLAGTTERRSVAFKEFEVRESGGSLHFEGYATVFNSAYDIYGGPDMGGWSERVLPSAFRKTLQENPDVQLLINHGGMPLARTKSGTLSLSTDRTGLLTRADLDLRDPDVQALRVKMDRGDLDQMSFAFRTIQDRWNDDETERDLVELSLDRGDVSIVNYGANPATSASLRGLLDDPDRVLTEARSLDPGALRSLQQVIGQALRQAQPETESATMSIEEARRMLAG